MEDLKELEMQIAERKNAPIINFDNTENPNAQVNKDTATQLVESAFNQAVVHRVSTDENVQKELLDSAGKVIQNKVNAVKEKADQEEKEAHFNNKKGACECFGYNEITTEKWAVNVMNAWHNVMTAIWLFIGFFTFAPVTFISKKIIVIFKKSWLAVVFALIIYFGFLAMPFIVDFLTKI